MNTSIPAMEASESCVETRGGLGTCFQAAVLAANVALSGQLELAYKWKAVGESLLRVAETCDLAKYECKAVHVFLCMLVSSTASAIQDAVSAQAWRRSFEETRQRNLKPREIFRAIDLSGISCMQSKVCFLWTRKDEQTIPTGATRRVEFLDCTLGAVLFVCNRSHVLQGLLSRGRRLECVVFFHP